MKNVRLVLDATAFYAGVPYVGRTISYTTPLVLDEVRHGGVRSAFINSLMESGWLVVVEPTKKSLELSRRSALKTGDMLKLSQADLSLLALAHEFKEVGYEVELVSDDYSVENVAKTVGIGVKPVMTRGISKVVTWIVYCRGCGKVFKGPIFGNVCDVCGTQLSRKRVRK